MDNAAQAATGAFAQITDRELREHKFAAAQKNNIRVEDTPPSPSPLQDICSRINRATARTHECSLKLENHADRLFGNAPTSPDSNALAGSPDGQIHQAFMALEYLSAALSRLDDAVERNITIA